MAEYKNCPVCHTINPPTAVECECGYRFREGEALTDKDIARMARTKKVRAVAGTCALVALIVILGLLTAIHGAIVLMYVLGFAVCVIAIAFVILKIIGKADSDKQDRGKR